MTTTTMRPLQIGKEDMESLFLDLIKQNGLQKNELLSQRNNLNKLEAKIAELNERYERQQEQLTNLQILLKPFTERVSNKRAAVRACQEIEANAPSAITTHILGGTPVDREEYPHMAAIAFSLITGGSQSYTFRCGGSLISKRHILSAAHCHYKTADPPIFARLGMLDTSVALNSDGQDINISNVTIPDNYIASGKYDDIAILTLERDAIFTTTVYPTCLYTDLEDPPSNFQYYASGWGTIETHKQSNILLKARLDIVPLARCNERFAEAGTNQNLARGVIQTQLCAHDPGYTKDACRGDSGGPLIQIRDATTRSYRIVGIISTGNGCATRTPGLYTRVAAYLDFIEKIVWKNL